MTKKLSVRLNGIEVGVLSLVNGKMEFAYKDNVKYPISLSLPLTNEVYKEKVCRSYFGGLLPENPNMRDLLSKKYKISRDNDFKLLDAIGRDCAGAISFHQKSEPEMSEDFVEVRGQVLSEEELYKHIEELPYKPYMGNRLSLAGAQEKTAVCLIDGKIALPDIDIPTTHIIKTALPKYTQSIQNEFICMNVARKVGIEVPNVEIMNANGIEFLLIERFDREFKDGKIRRILQEDFAQSLGVQSRDKYDVTIKDCVWVLNQTTVPAKSKMEFVKRVIFNYLIGNTDAHSKNFSISFNDGVIGFTPAYDLLCSSIYDCDQRIAMKIGRSKYYKDIQNSDWELFAKDIDISPKIVMSELNRQKGLIVTALKEVLQEHECEVGYKILEYTEMISK